MSAPAGKPAAASLMTEMLGRVSSEVARYERIITYWPAFAPDLEAAACAVLREVVGAMSRQCGFVQVCLVTLMACCRCAAPAINLVV